METNQVFKYWAQRINVSSCHQGLRKAIERFHQKIFLAGAAQKNGKSKFRFSNIYLLVEPFLQAREKIEQAPDVGSRLCISENIGKEEALKIKQEILAMLEYLNLQKSFGTEIPKLTEDITEWLK
jgi:hypothetical protein